MNDKTEKENLFHHFFIELLFEHVTVNETGVLASLPTKETGFNILYIPFLFISNQFISKQSLHVKLLMLTQARRNRGRQRGGGGEGGRIDRNY